MAFCANFIVCGSRTHGNQYLLNQVIMNDIIAGNIGKIDILCEFICAADRGYAGGS